MQFSARGEPDVEHRKLRSILDRVNWDDLQVVQVAAEASSLRKAGELSRMAVNTVRARIDRVEEALGSTLFARGRSGLNITAEGREVVDIVREMRSLDTALPRGRGNNSVVRDGEIRLFATEGIATFWLTPRLLELRALLKDRKVSLDSMADQRQIDRADYDITISFDRPEDDEAIVTKLATIHVIPFSSELYLRQTSIPTSLDDLPGHQYVQQLAPGLKNDALDLFFASDMLQKFVTIRVSSSYALFWAIASGAGIGVLPTYIRALSRRVVPLDIPVQLRFELWASYDRAYRRSAQMRITMDWLREAFNPARYPWFADKFVHPREFGDLIGDSQVIPLFDHMIDDTL